MIKLLATTAAILLALTACTPADKAAPVQPAASTGAGSKAAAPKQAPVKLAAAKTGFKAGVLAEGSDYTSVKVTVTNNTSGTLEINPLYFAVTDTGGTRHECDALGVDDRQISDTKLQPGEKATGTVTAKGRFTARTVTFTKDGFGTAYRAEVG